MLLGSCSQIRPISSSPSSSTQLELPPSLALRPSPSACSLTGLPARQLFSAQQGYLLTLFGDIFLLSHKNNFPDWPHFSAFFVVTLQWAGLNDALITLSKKDAGNLMWNRSRGMCFPHFIFMSCFACFNFELSLGVDRCASLTHPWGWPLCGRECHLRVEPAVRNSISGFSSSTGSGSFSVPVQRTFTAHASFYCL